MREVAVTEGDKVEAQARLGFSVNGYGVSELAAARRRGRPTPRSTSLVDAVRGDVRRRPEPLRRGGDRHAELRDGRPDRGRRCGRSSRTAASARSPTRSRTSASCAQLPGIGVQRLMADGYGFGAEGDWKAARAGPHPQGHGARACPAARRSWRTTPTTWATRSPRSSARTCSRSARRSRTATAVVRDPPALDRRPVGPGPARVRRRARARRSSSAWPTWATGSG